MKLSSFKQPASDVPLPPRTPSPILRFVEPLTPTYPTAYKDGPLFPNNGASGLVEALQNYGWSVSNARAGKQTSSEKVQTVKAERVAPSSRQTNGNGSRSSSHGSPIDALADVASSMVPSPVFAPPTVLPVHSHPSPRTSTRPAASGSRHSHASSDGQNYRYSQSYNYGYDHGYGCDERPSKRARSEVAPSDQYAPGAARPATSHAPAVEWAFNVEPAPQGGHSVYPEQASYSAAPTNIDEMDIAQVLLGLRNGSIDSTRGARRSIAAPQAHYSQTGFSSWYETPSTHAQRPAEPQYREHGFVDGQYRSRPHANSFSAPKPEPLLNGSEVSEAKFGYPSLSAVQTHTPPDETGKKASKASTSANDGMLVPFREDGSDQLQSPQSLPGFKNAKEVSSVDKYFCRACKPKFGPTTFVRKSKRAQAGVRVDYAGLNEGVFRTSEDEHEHHYIQLIKDGAFKFQPETFPRVRPELITAENLEKSGGFKEPIVIPACWNPRPSFPGPQTKTTDISTIDQEEHPDEFYEDVEYETVPDEGQDYLDMVIPQGLTVRRVAELYGPEEKVEVIDVKSQEGEDKRWNMNKWADYYEEEGDKPVRNVISLEISHSMLGRLIRRPKVVRDLDLQDAVWPEEETAKGVFPKVQFYCLMSVADCYTDFHIDFGGSSVYYHIIKGKKTFFFIPPKKQHLKKYEDWCLSQAQNWTFLADETKECYRVDLSEGDTMLIPSGWIHAVWTPENSLVIGGNFLTRLNYGMQIRVAEIEKNTKVARKFRYPHFQKVHWYTVLQYLQRDPLPQSVMQLFYEGKQFHRVKPVYSEPNKFGHNSDLGPENYNARFYSRHELDGLPDLQDGREAPECPNGRGRLTKFQ
ncbi:phd finger and domain [Neofusicoccum parvum]|nr:phd finger and domain [Neofusicoccum parvum]